MQVKVATERECSQQTTIMPLKEARDSRSGGTRKKILVTKWNAFVTIQPPPTKEDRNARPSQKIHHRAAKGIFSGFHEVITMVWYVMYAPNPVLV
jgi:hypothetical protein